LPNGPLINPAFVNPRNGRRGLVFQPAPATATHGAPPCRCTRHTDVRHRGSARFANATPIHILFRFVCSPCGGGGGGGGGGAGATAGAPPPPRQGRVLSHDGAAAPPSLGVGTGEQTASCPPAFTLAARHVSAQHMFSITSRSICIAAITCVRAWAGAPGI
jgi:hypothetical protein